MTFVRFGSRKVRRLIVMFVISLLICFFTLGIGIVSYNNWCETFTHMPDAPVYPGSTLIDQSSSGGIYWLADQNYVSSDAPDKIVDFYIDQMFHYGYAAGTRCPVRSLGGECYGNAQPFGQYSVYLDRDSSLNNQSTKFTIEFRWRGCGWDI